MSTKSFEEIKHIGGTMPEKLPKPEKGIPEIEAEQRKLLKKGEKQ